MADKEQLRAQHEQLVKALETTKAQVKALETYKLKATLAELVANNVRPGMQKVALAALMGDERAIEDPKGALEHLLADSPALKLAPSGTQPRTPAPAAERQPPAARSLRETVAAEIARQAGK